MEKLNPKSIDNILALTPLQEGMLFHYLKDPQSQLYFEQLSLDITGAVDHELFEEAWNVVINSNEMLKVVFRWEKVDNPIQIVLKEYKFQVRYIDLSATDASERKERLEEIKRIDAQEKFNLHEVPFRVTLCKIEDDEYVMIISNHHILYDGWSNGIILKEFFKVYQLLFHGERSIKLPEKPSFNEFIKWSKNQDKKEQQQFWREYLIGFETPTEVPIKKRKEETTVSEDYSIILGDDIKCNLDVFVKNNRVTLASIFYASWGILLQKYCGSEDVILGTTVSGRSASVKGIENMVGLFINTIPLRVQAAPGTKMAQIVSMIENSIKKREEFESTPLPDIRSYSEVNGSGSLFDTLVIIENYPLDNRLLPSESSLKINAYTMFEMTHYDLSVGIMPANDIEIKFSFKRELIEKEAVVNLAGHFKRILQAIVDYPEMALSQLEIITNEEKNRILNMFNDTAEEYHAEKTIHQLFEEQVSRMSDNIALVGEDMGVCPTRNVSLTYRQLNEQSVRLARLLIEKGVLADEIVAIMMERSIDLIIGIMGILKSGGAYLPIDTDYPKERIDYILRDSNAKIIVTHEFLKTVLQAPLHHSSSILIGRPRRGLHHSNLCYVIYTSGSTGKPKGVMIKHRSAVNVLFAVQNKYPFTPSDTYLLKTSYTFDVSVTELFGWHMGGGKLAILEAGKEKDPQAILEWIYRYRVTHINFVPSMFTAFLEYLAEQNKGRLNGLRYIFLAGEAVLPSQVKKFRNLNTTIALENLYGPTEGTVYSSGYSLSEWDGTGSVPIGKPLANIELYILDKYHHLQPQGVPGELCIAGVGLAPGYLNRPELTADRFYRSYKSYRTYFHYKTGDLARWLNDGNIEFLGRIDRQVKIRGFRIETGEIETQLMKHPDVCDAVVVVKTKETGTGDSYLCAYIVSPLPYTELFDRLREFLTLSLPEYMVPAYFVLLEKVPLTPSGKLDRRALPEPEIALGKEQVMPRNETEVKLADIWSGVLGIDSHALGIDADFSRLGGHSIKLMHLAVRISRELGIDIPLSELFRLPTIRTQGHFIRQSGKVEKEGDKHEDKRYVPIQSIPQQEYYEISYAQRRLWIICQFEEDSIAYNEVGGLAIKGKFNPSAFDRAIRTLAQRHESLRTVFIIVDGEPKQKILPHVELGLEQEDLRHLQGAEQEAAAALIIKNSANKAFNLGKGPLAIFKLLRLEDEKYFLLVNIHHIINDGWSIGVIKHELNILYNFFNENRSTTGEIPLAPVTFQYKDYTLWHNQLITNGYFDKFKDYWLEKFNDKPTGIELPLDHPRGAVQTFNGGRVFYKIEETETASLWELCQLSHEENANLFIKLMTILNIFLHKYSGEKDIIVGAPIAGRKQPELHHMIGFLVNTLVYRVQVDPGESCRQLMAKVKKEILACFENQDYPFDILVERLGLARDISRSPLFNVMMVFGDADTRGEDIRFSGTEVEFHDQMDVFNPSVFDLVFLFYEKGKHLDCEIMYNCDLFERATIQRMAKNFLTLMKNVLGNINKPVFELEYIQKEEYQTIIHHFNDNKEEFMPMTIQELVEKQVEKSLNSVAVVSPEGWSITYNELNKKANQLAHYLRREYVIGPGKVIGICIERSIEMIIAVLGVVKTGAAYLSFDPNYPRDRVEHMIKDSRAQLVIIDQSRPDLFDINEEKGQAPIYIHQHWSAIGLEPFENPKIENELGDAVYVIYTSGSTGTPNGAILSQALLSNLIQWQAKDTVIDGSLRCLQFTSINFCVSFQEIFTTLSSGGEVHLIGDIERQDITYLMKFLVRRKIGNLYLPFSYLNFLFNLSSETAAPANTYLQHIVTAGEQLKITGGLKKFLEQNPGIKLHNHYGSSEMHVVTSFTLDAATASRLPIPPAGKPIANTRIYILDENEKAVPIGVWGELFVDGSSEVLGYIHNPGLTDKKLVWNPEFSPFSGQRLYSSGDVGRWLPDGNIELKGRKDFQVKIRGFRVELSEIESKILAFKKVKDCVVVVKENPQGGEKTLVAYIVAPGLDVNELKRRLGSFLPQYMIPKFMVLESLPLMPNGKVDRDRLPILPTGLTVGEDVLPEVPPDRINELLTEWSASKPQTELEWVISRLTRFLVGRVLPDRAQISHVDIDIFRSEESRLRVGATDSGFFEEQAARTPDTAAVVGKDFSISYQELNRRANRLASLLRKKGVNAGSVVGLMLAPSVEMIVGILGILKAGGAYLPIASDTSTDTVISMLEDHNAQILLTSGKDLGKHPFALLQGVDIIAQPPFVTAPRPQIMDFNSLPFPDRSLVSYEKYSRYVGLGMVKNTITLQATRGCPYNCLYCHKIWPKKHVFRSAENIFQEVEHYYRLGVRRFTFADDIFNLDNTNSRRFFELVVNNRLDVNLFFPNGLRSDLLTPDYIDLMVEAGTAGVAMALETASPRLQKLIRKHLHLDKLRENIDYFCRRHPQVILELFTMHGFPTETEEEAQMTFDFVKNRHWIDFPYLLILKIYPNTDMATLALENGIQREAITRSAHMAYHELPETLPFDKGFTLKYQSDFANEYFLLKERLLAKMPYQMKVMTPDEMVEKYNSYLPVEITTFASLLEFLKLRPEELGLQLEKNGSPLSETYPLVRQGVKPQHLDAGISRLFAPQNSEPSPDALRILLLDLSQFFSHEREILYDGVEPPLGLMALLTYLKRELGSRVNGRIAKARVDFDHDNELKALLEEFKPQVIGIRTLSHHRDFFHKTLTLIRQWGVDVPIIAGGPYATSDYSAILQSRQVDIVVLSEGELTFTELIVEIIKSNGQLPEVEVLEKIQGIAFIPRNQRDVGSTCRDIVLMDGLDYALAREIDKNPELLGQHKGLALPFHDNNGAFKRGKPVVSWVFDGSSYQVFNVLAMGGSLCVAPEVVSGVIGTGEVALMEFYRSKDSTSSEPSFNIRLELQENSPLLKKQRFENDVEEKLAEIWAELLDVDKKMIGRDDSFFELGGHSLKAATMITRIHKNFNSSIKLIEIFKDPTLRGIGELIRTAAAAPFTVISPVESREYYPLSAAQKRMYILQMMDVENTAYNMPRVMELEGEVDKERLEKAVNMLIQRHEAFRTSFEIKNEKPVQIIHHHVEFEIEYFTADKHGRTQTFLMSFIRPFDLSQAPLLRVELMRLAEKRHLLMVDMHHIISDGVSIEIMIKDFMALYSGEELPKVGVTYKDYSEWQNRERVGKKILDQGEYWKKEFEGEIPVLELPIDYARPAAQFFEGNRINFEINKETSDALKVLTLESGVTLYILLLALYNILLAKISSQEDIVIGTVVAGRRHADLEKIIGMFVNTLALRNFPSGEKELMYFLNEVKESTLKAFENQEYQFEDLVEAVTVSRDVNRNPLFDTMFSLQNIGSQEIEIPGLKLLPYPFEYNTAKFDLELTAVEEEENLSFTLEYSTNLFKPETIQRFIAYFKNIINRVVESKNHRISRLEILSEVELKRLLVEFNNTQKEYPKDKTLHRLFAEQLEKSPDKIALVGASALESLRVASLQITYRQLHGQSNRLAYLLREKGVDRDGLVGILCKRSIEIVTAILSVWKAGGAYIPMNNDLPLERLITILVDSEARVLLALSDSFPDMQEYYVKIGTHTAVKHIIYLDKLENPDHSHNLFKTIRFASLLGQSMDIKPGKEQVLHYNIQTFTHQEYMRRVKQLTQFILSQDLELGSHTAVMISNPIYKVIALLSLNFLQIPFIIIDTDLPGNRRKKIIEEFEIKTVFVQSNLLDELDRWLWESDTLKNYIIFDPYNLRQNTRVADVKQIWNYVAEESSEAINDYGWTDSYTNKPFSIEEMKQYIWNFKIKLKSFLNPRSRVLEIGCGHGLVLFEIAPGVSFYFATDLSEVIIEKNRKRLQREAVHNVKLKTASAPEIDTLDEKEFDLVICSSVIHYFPNSLYLEKVIIKAIDILKNQGIIYLDDLMDLDKKHELVRSTLEFKKLNPEARTKTEWDGDLFVKKEFFRDLQAKYPEIIECEISSKLGDIKNELTDFRYDVVLKINKEIKTTSRGILKKNRCSWEDIDQYPGATTFSIANEAVKDKANDGNFVGDVTDISTIEKYSTGILENLNHPADLAYIIYTSGTTGKPKGVMIEHRGMVNHIYAKINDLQLDDLSIVAQNASQMFDISVWQFFSALITGGRTVIFPNELILDPMNFMAHILKCQINILEVVPSYLAALLDIPGGEYSYSSLPLQYLLVTGEAVNPAPLKRWFLKYPGIKVVNAYGPTEASDDITHYIMGQAPEMDQVPIGSPVQNMNIYIVDKYMVLCPLGVPGELCVSGVGIGRGYLNRPELIAEKFDRDLWDSKDDQDKCGTLRAHFHHSILYRTGDLARWLPDGNLEFLGRSDHQVKLRGYRIELGEIENRILKYEAIKEAVVTAREEGGGDKSLHAYIVSDRQYDPAGIREFLSRQLPDYMIPSYFVRLDKIPLTPNGKVDRKALPGPEGISLRENVGCILPSSDVEKKLVEIWEKVLDRTNIGINENFFHVGGDSIKSIQIISRLNNAGYKLEIKDLFQYPVISELAPRVTKLKRIPGQSSITGTIPLTPIQRAFFAESHINPHHYNQALMLHSKEGFDKEAVMNVFSSIQAHHDALRMTYYRDEDSGEIIQVNRGLEYPLYLEEHDLRNREQSLAELNDKTNGIQESIDLEKGPLMKLGLFHLNDGDRLLIVIHHLVIDGVSWGILLEDIEALYGQYKRGEKLVLPSKTDSFKLWSEKLSAYANSKTFLKEKTYWQNVESLEASLITKDFHVEDNYIKDSGSTSFTLGEEETSLLLTKVNRAYKTEINDILLTALGVGIKKNFALDHVLIGLEGHGREEIFEGLDIGRTVGCFTSTYPVVLDISYADNPGRQIKEIKEILRRIPNKGIGYGILKYLSGEENKKEIEFKLKPQISFNFIGQFDADLKQISSFEPARESTGNAHSQNNKREYLLNVSGMTVNNRLTMTISFNKTHFKPETISALAENFETELRYLITFCSGKETVELTPADFTYKGLTMESVDRLVVEYPGIEDIYTLTPMQEGMLFHAIADDSSYSYFQYVSYRMLGELDIKLVEKSLNELFKRHDILRTAFVYNNIERPVQLVLKDRTIDFFYEDIRKMGEADEKENFIREFKTKDKNRLFDLTRDTLMRVSIFRLEEMVYEFSWSLHHILMDGWCVGILNTEFFEIYGSFMENRPHRLPEAKPYRIYLQWLEKRDADKSKDYWKKYLENYEEPVGIPQIKILKADEKAYKNEFYIFELENGMTADLKKLAVQNNVTVNNIIQSLWGIILGKYSGKKDVVFGAVVSGRPPEIKGVESMVGLFINTIPVRFRFEGNTRFNELLRVAKEEFVNSEPHHYYPLAKIQANTHLKQNLLNHILGFQNIPLEEKIESAADSPDKDNGSKEKVGWTLTQVEYFEQTNYDFSVSIFPGEKLEINFNYNGNVYELDFVEIIANHFKHLIRQALNNNAILIDAMTLLTEKEKKRILYDFNEKIFESPADTCIPRLFEQQVEKSLDRIAVTYKADHLTYNALNEKADRLAYVLREKGIGPDLIVGLLLNRSIEMITGILAVLKSGGAYLPIHINVARDRILFMLEDSRASLLLTESGIFDTFSFSILQGLHEVKSAPYVTSVRPAIRDLDGLPIPDRTLIDYEKYSRSLGQAMIKNTYITLFLTRGCPFNCAYCHKIWPKTHAYRSAEHIFAEVKYFYDLGVRRFVIIDDIFNFDKTNSSRFFHMIIENNMDVRFFFTGGLRGDLLTREYIDLLVKAGAVNIALALETASPRIQKLVGKNLHLEKFRENIEYICEKYPHVVLELFTMHGFPTETEEEAMMTLDFIKSLKWVHFPYVNILRIYANTPMEKLAIENGISHQSIIRSEGLAYHELPETLPFDKSFTSRYQAQFFNEYFLSKERLLHVLPYQMKVFTEEEMVEKYDSFLPVDIGSFDDLLKFVGIKREELGLQHRFLDPGEVLVPDFNQKLKKNSRETATQHHSPGALRVLLLDLSQYFSSEKKMLYDLFEPPMGLMSLMTYLKERLGSKVNGKVAKSRVDFDSFSELKVLLEEYDPQVIGIRTLTLYKDFFHKTAALIRQWGFDVPIITGGPYASGNYKTILQDRNIDLVVLGEGELTFCELITKVLENNGKLPGEALLKDIPGIAFIPQQPKGLKKSSRELLMLDELRYGLSREPGNHLEKVNQPRDIAYIIYTSGSTGIPKGVMVEHRNVVSYIHAFYKNVPISAEDIVIQQASYAFDTFVEEVFSILFRGGKIAIPGNHEVMDINLLIDFLAKKSITILDSSPLLLNELNKSGGVSRIPVRKIISGGDLLRGEYIYNLLKIGKLFNSYGPTETTVCVTYFEFNGNNRFNVPVGKPMANNHVYILDEQNRLLPIGVSGQLCVSGHGVSRGYLNDPELTAEKFDRDLWDSKNDPDKWGTLRATFHPSFFMLYPSILYHTGDLARWLPDGNIEFKGRIDRQVKIRGFRIELEEIELALLRSGLAKEAVVLANERNEEKYLCAYIVPSGDRNTPKTTAEELREYLSRILPNYMIPSYFVQLEKIPRTTSGKVDRNILPDPVLKLAKETYAPPANETERKLSQVWQEVLGVENIGSASNFFEFGGDSIKAIQVSSGLKKYGLDLKITDLFLYPTIRQLVKYVTETEQAIPQETVSGEVVLTPIQQWFFQSDLTDNHHFNQSVMLFNENGFDEAMLKKVFTKIVEHHDGLRMIYNFRQDIVIQVNRGLEGKLFDFEVYDFTSPDYTKINSRERIEKEVDRIQGEIDLKVGPLVKIGLFKSRWGDHFLIVIHHLVVDGVSWRILLEDFAVGCQQWEKGEEIQFQKKTHSFKYWAQRLKEYAEGGGIGENNGVLEELGYWKSIDTVRVELLPVDFEIDVAARRSKNNKTVILDLNSEETELLLKQTNWVYMTEINDILLAALAMSIKEWAGVEKVCINLEGHGREPIIAGIDVGRTVGWFTTMFPVILDMSRTQNLSYVIKSVKETLRRIPNKGIGYGILKYLTPDDKKGGYRFSLEPQISFNYLGQFGLESNSELAGKWGKISDLSTGNAVSSESEIIHVIDINCILMDGRLKSIFTYNKYEYEANRIEQLVQCYKSNLLTIIEHCCKMEEKESTPSDMGYVGISIEELEELENDVINII